jgi:enamine deaminase RidA (YjgF/YER057c/UK114 family)
MNAKGPHEILNPSELAPPLGFSHAVVPAVGRTVYLGGQTGVGLDGELRSKELVGQFDAAAENVVTALNAAGANPEHLVSLQIFTTDVEEYRARTSELAEVYGRHIGRHYPAIALFGIERLWDAEAMVELMGIAVIPDSVA